MKRFSQIELAKQVGVSSSFISQLVKGSKRPSWKRAKQLASVTCTSADLWLDGTPEQIKAALAGEKACACASE
ncbi:MAG TPA: hypothetical protein DCZ95_12475 [Verrucomicrobia bacterium]|nr:hypothetical protein [Verrucomicrobiota bacterium]